MAKAKSKGVVGDVESMAEYIRSALTYYVSLKETWEGAKPGQYKTALRLSFKRPWLTDQDGDTYTFNEAFGIKFGLDAAGTAQAIQALVESGLFAAKYTADGHIRSLALPDSTTTKVTRPRTANPVIAEPWAAKA